MSVAEGQAKVIVEAEDEESKRFEFEYSVDVHAPLRSVAVLWADRHAFMHEDGSCDGVPANCVGLELAEEPYTAIDLDKDTLAALGCVAGSTFHVRAVPTDKACAEPGVLEQIGCEKAAVPSAQPPSQEDDAAQPPAAKKAKLASSSAPATPEAKASAATEPKANTPIKPKALKAPEPKAKATPEVAKAKAKAKPKSLVAAGVGAVPQGDEKIKYEPNPKREGSAAYERYGKYMKAKTVNEALALGASKADISFDFKKGLLKRVP